MLRFLSVAALVVLVGAAPLWARWNAFITKPGSAFSPTKDSWKILDEYTSKFFESPEKGEWVQVPKLEMPQRFRNGKVKYSVAVKAKLYGRDIYLYASAKDLADVEKSEAARCVALALCDRGSRWLDALARAYSLLPPDWTKLSKEMAFALVLRLDRAGVAEGVQKEALKLFVKKAAEMELTNISTDDRTVTENFRRLVKRMPVEAGHWFWGNDSAPVLCDKAAKLLMDAATSTNAAPQ